MTYLHLEMVNGKRHTMRKHGHVVTSAVFRKRDAKSLYSLRIQDHGKHPDNKKVWITEVGIITFFCTTKTSDS